MGFEEFRSSRRCLYIETEVVESSYERERFFLVGIGYRCEYRAVVYYLHSGRLKRFVERSCKAVVISYRLSRGFHFGGEVCVKTAELREGERRYFYIVALLFGRIYIENALLGKRFSENCERSYIRKRVACGFGKEWNRA